MRAYGLISTTSVKAALIHLLASFVLAALVAGLIFFVWYPWPYSRLASGINLFFIIIIVDVICGPLLTLVVFKPQKPRRELILDMSIILLIQIGALSYGLHTIAQARPVFLSFEYNRFRVVTYKDVCLECGKYPEEDFAKISLLGPKLISAKPISEHGQEFLDSVRRAIEGEHPSFRPDQWVPYETQREAIIENADSIADLKKKNPDRVGEIEGKIASMNLRDEDLLYINVVHGIETNWVAIISKETLEPVLFMNIDGW